MNGLKEDLGRLVQANPLGRRNPWALQREWPNFRVHRTLAPLVSFLNRAATRTIT